MAPLRRVAPPSRRLSCGRLARRAGKNPFAIFEIGTRFKPRNSLKSSKALMYRGSSTQALRLAKRRSAPSFLRPLGLQWRSTNSIPGCFHNASDFGIASLPSFFRHTFNSYRSNPMHTGAVHNQRGARSGAANGGGFAFPDHAEHRRVTTHQVARQHASAGASGVRSGNRCGKPADEPDVARTEAQP